MANIKTTAGKLQEFESDISCCVPGYKHTMRVQAKYSPGASYFAIACCRLFLSPPEVLLRARGIQSYSVRPQGPVVSRGLWQGLWSPVDSICSFLGMVTCLRSIILCTQHQTGSITMGGWNFVRGKDSPASHPVAPGSLPHAPSAAATLPWKQRNQWDFSSSTQRPIPLGRWETSGMCKIKRDCKIRDRTSDTVVLL